MPIYEYVCKSCGHELEEWQKMADKPLRKCPGCGLLKLERIVSRSSFQLKGDGWYTTGGYGSKGKTGTKSGSGSSSGSSSGGSSSSGSSSDGSSSGGSKSSDSGTKKASASSAA